MFWGARSPIDRDDEEWQLECWRWLANSFAGWGPLSERRLVLPNSEFFPATDHEGHARAQRIFKSVADCFGVPPEQFVLSPQDEAIDPRVGNLMVVQNAPLSPAGTFQVGDDGHLHVTYDPAAVDRPGELIATLAHEICHPLLLSIPEPPPGGEACEEFATDLAVTFFGFGIFGENSAFQFEQFSDIGSGTQGWAARRQGYLTEAEWAFSLAVFLLVTGEPEKVALDYLKPGPAAYLNKSLKYLRANEGILDGILDTSASQA